MDIAAPSPLTNSGAPTPLHEAPTTSLTATSKPSVIAMEVDVGPGLDDDDDVDGLDGLTWVGVGIWIDLAMPRGRATGKLLV
ncbi:hypothetical protein WJX77_004515 [Trebouxia sp. C0004]